MEVASFLRLFICRIASYLQKIDQAMPRNTALTTTDGQTGHLIAELLLTNPGFSSKINKPILITSNPSHPFCKESWWGDWH
jgi:hypothetical protein